MIYDILIIVSAFLFCVSIIFKLISKFVNVDVVFQDLKKVKILFAVTGCCSLTFALIYSYVVKLLLQ